MSRFRPARRGVIDFGRIDIIAHAMDHEDPLVQLRMSVNKNENHFHKRSQLAFEAQ